MKKTIIWIICIALILTGVWWLFGERAIVTGDVQDIVKITVTKYTGGNGNDHHFTDRGDIEQIANNLKQTKILRVERFPDHVESLQNDTPYLVCVMYNDGTKDEIRFSENKEIVFRMLNTKGKSGDRGWVKGENKSLLAFFDEFIK